MSTGPLDGYRVVELGQGIPTALPCLGLYPVENPARLIQNEIVESGNDFCPP